MKGVTDDQDHVPARLEHAERVLPGALAQAAGLFPAHSPDLVRRAEARGRRLRRVRHTQLGGATAVLLLVGGGALWAGGVAGDGHGVARPVPAGSVVTVPSLSPSGPPAPSPPPSSSPAGFVRAQDQLAALLPKRGTVIQANGFGGIAPDRQLAPNPQDPIRAWVDFTDGQGTASVLLNVQDTTPEPAVHNCAGWPAEACQKVQDGTVVQVESSGPDGKGQLRWMASVFHPDGRNVVVVELVNATSDGKHPLALSPDEVRAVALSPQWNK